MMEWQVRNRIWTRTEECMRLKAILIGIGFQMLQTSKLKIKLYLPHII